MYPYLHFAGKMIPTYGLLLIVAAVAAWLMLIALSKKKGVYTDDISFLFLLSVSGGFAGAVILRPLMKVVEVAIEWERFRPMTSGDLLHHLTGETVFYGGLLGGIAAVLIFHKRFNVKISLLFDLFAPALAFAHSIGRVGCLFAGCCYGVVVPNGHIFSIVYPAVSVGAPSGVPLLAVPLIEAIFLFALSLLLIVVFLKSKHDGLCTSIYLSAYSIERFIIEFFRGDLIRGRYGIFTTSQFISIAVFLFAIVCFIRFRIQLSIEKEKTPSYSYE